MATRPFRFGLLLERFSSHEALLRTTRQAEAAGFSTLLIRDHFTEEPFGHQFAPLVTLGVAAQATTTLRVGTLVIDNDYRHPALLAKEGATLDVLSDGRFELGLGAGWARDEYTQIGLSYDQPGARISRLVEGIQVLKGLWGQEPFSFDGQHYQIRGLDSFRNRSRSRIRRFSSAPAESACSSWLRVTLTSLVSWHRPSAAGSSLATPARPRKPAWPSRWTGFGRPPGRVSKPSS
jgi:probable F420-dependent oxidoreductase